jgi:hypothetical protein
LRPQVIPLNVELRGQWRLAVEDLPHVSAANFRVEGVPRRWRACAKKNGPVFFSSLSQACLGKTAIAVDKLNDEKSRLQPKPALETARSH